MSKTTKSSIVSNISTNLNVDNKGLIEIAVSSFEEKLYQNLDALNEQLQTINSDINANLKARDNEIETFVSSFKTKETNEFLKSLAKFYEVNEKEISNKKFAAIGVDDDGKNVIKVHFRVALSGVFTSEKTFKVNIPAPIKKLMALRDDLEKKKSDNIALQLDIKRRLKDMSRIERKARANFAKELLRQNGHEDMILNLEDTSSFFDVNLTKALSK
jgi:hypothetical protein